MEELNERIIPMLNEQLEYNDYFCGDDITIYDIMVFCELNSIMVIAEKEVKPVVQSHENLDKWRTSIYIVKEVRDIEDTFSKEMKKLIKNGPGKSGKK